MVKKIIMLALFTVLVIFLFGCSDGEPGEEMIPDKLPIKPDEPILSLDTIEIKKDSYKNMVVGFQNKMNETVQAGIVISRCIYEDGTQMTPPEIISPIHSVLPGGYKDYAISIQLSGYDTGIYVCTLAVVDSMNTTQSYYKKDFFLSVIA